MKKTVFISQPFGIGDILFIQKVVLHYARMGFHVVVPILQSLSWLRYYIQPHPDVEYPTLISHRGMWSGNFKFSEMYVSLYAGSLFETDNPLYDTPLIYNGGDPETGFVFIPVSACYERMPGARLMPSKFEFVGLDFSDWVDHVHFRRRPHVERELYYDVLGLTDKSRYTLVNEQSSRSALPLPVPGNTVRLAKIDGFTLFDWSMVVERAAQIVTIDTSLVILTELLRQKKPLYMVSRYSPPSFVEIEDILKLNWTLVPTPADLDVAAIA